MNHIDLLSRGVRLTSASPDVNWRAPDFSLVYVRASFGTERDPKFLSNFSSAKHAGLRVGLYHHFRQSRRPDLQAQVFLDAAGVLGYGAHDLWPVLSFENDEASEGSFNEEIYNIGGKILADTLWSSYGGCVLKFSREVWQKMDCPAWVFRYPYWLEETELVEQIDDRSHVIEGLSSDRTFSTFVALTSLPTIQPPPQDLTEMALDDLASGLELIARGIRKLKMRSGHSVSTHGHEHGHGTGRHLGHDH